jgi:hypothetical protein
MGSACRTAQDPTDGDNLSEHSDDEYANVLRTHFPSQGVSPTHAVREVIRRKSDTNAPPQLFLPANDAITSDGATNDVRSPMPTGSSPTTLHPNLDVEVVPFVPVGRQQMATFRRDTSPASSMQQQGEGLLHLTALHSKSGRANSTSFATFADGMGSSSGGADPLTENQVAVMPQAVFAAVSATTDDTALSSLGAGGVFPAAAQFQASAVRQRSSFFTATGTDSGTGDVSMMAMEPSFEGFVATHGLRSDAPNPPAAQMVEERRQTNLPFDSNDGSWFGRDSMSLHSASGRNRQSTTSFGGFVVAVPANSSADGRLGLATFPSHRN